MKLKKIGTQCTQAGYFILNDYERNGEESTQWLGDGDAMYLLENMPYMREENIFAMFDVNEKKRNKITFRHCPPVSGINLEDLDRTEQQIREYKISLVLGGGYVTALKTRRGVRFIRGKYLDPLEDSLDTLQLFERYTDTGVMYIAVKVGFYLVAIIRPMSAKELMGETVVSELEELAFQCRECMREPPRPRVNEATGEVVEEDENND